jgi:hypothetical protein
MTYQDVKRALNLYPFPSYKDKLILVCLVGIWSCLIQICIRLKKSRSWDDRGD